MRNTNRVIGIITAIAALGCSSEDTTRLGESQQAFHSWNGYHWKSDSLSPTVADKTRSSLYDVPGSVADWSTVASNLDPVMSLKKSGKVTVSEGFSLDWLGLAQVWLEDGHIVKGAVKLNTTFLEPRGAHVAQHVLCQELGHVWGLDHNRFDLDTCMNDCGDATTQDEWEACLAAPSSDTPNAHDYEELSNIYGHGDPGAEGSGGGKPCKGNNPKCNGSVVVHVFPLYE